jgi:hypothetical protein
MVRLHRYPLNNRCPVQDRLLQSPQAQAQACMELENAGLLGSEVGLPSNEQLSTLTRANHAALTRANHAVYDPIFILYIIIIHTTNMKKN